ncbi:MAG TPA: polysaccharide biosynthesis/export family protein [Mucilaginibacter sp.]|jgi:polysaccharide export outer membrane protein
MKKNIYEIIFLFLTIAVLLTSCINQKQIAYFQKAPNQSDTIAVAKAYVPKIQPGDILSIAIGSLNPLASSFFNPYSTMPIDNNTQSQNVGTPQTSGLSSSPTQPIAPGYLVDVAGNIELPLLGPIRVEGLTTVQAKELVKNKLKLYLKEPTVNVRLLNYRISVMGEVMHPSVYIIPNESVTLPEALSMAGDMTIFGKRENVLVIRDINGKKEFGRVDLTTRDVYNSPYYYLHSNDIVYVEPGKGRIAQTDKTYQILPIILSALSFIAIIFTYSHIKF